MRMNRKQKWLFILILIILTFIYHNLILPKKEKEKYLNDTVETLNKEFNLKINKSNYKTVDAYFKGWLEIHYYRIEKRIKNQKNIKFKYSYSGILGNCENMISDDGKYTSFFSKEKVTELLNLIRNYGFGPYFLNEFIYDKSKGNDFEKIEQILSKYEKKYDLYFHSDSYSCINFIKTSKFLSPSILNVDADSEDYYEVLQIEKKFISYFSVERDFDKIDWYEFKKYLDIKPILYFSSNASKEELQKLLEEIKPYYNKNEYIITFSSKKSEKIW